PRLGRRLLSDLSRDFRAGSKFGGGGRSLVADRTRRRRICGDAGYAGLSRGAAGNALALTGRPDSLYWHGPHRILVARLACGPHRIAQRHGCDRRSWLAGARRNLALVEADIGMKWPPATDQSKNAARDWAAFHSEV